MSNRLLRRDNPLKKDIDKDSRKAFLMLAEEMWVKLMYGEGLISIEYAVDNLQEALEKALQNGHIRTVEGGRCKECGLEARYWTRLECPKLTEVYVPKLPKPIPPVWGGGE